MIESGKVATDAAREQEAVASVKSPNLMEFEIPILFRTLRQTETVGLTLFSKATMVL